MAVRRLRADLRHSHLRAGDKFTYKYTYYLSDEVTPSNPTRFYVVVRHPDGSTTERDSSPDVVGSANIWNVAITLDVGGDWWIEARAEFSDGAESELHYLSVSDSLTSQVRESGFSLGFSEGFGA